MYMTKLHKFEQRIDLLSYIYLYVTAIQSVVAREEFIEWDEERQAQSYLYLLLLFCRAFVLDFYFLVLRNAINSIGFVCRAHKRRTTVFFVRVCVWVSFVHRRLCLLPLSVTVFVLNFISLTWKLCALALAVALPNANVWNFVCHSCDCKMLTKSTAGWRTSECNSDYHINKRHHRYQVLEISWVKIYGLHMESGNGSDSLRSVTMLCKGGHNWSLQWIGRSIKTIQVSVWTSTLNTLWHCLYSYNYLSHHLAWCCWCWFGVTSAPNIRGFRASNTQT